MRTERRVRLAAHAKLNLGLVVHGKRDDGLHEIDTLFSRLSLHDELWLESAGGLSGELESVVGGPELHGLKMDADNLALRAAAEYLRTAGLLGGVAIRLRKRIPVAAGLGGGSSDAAAVLTGMARLYPADLHLAPLAERLGSDVPFFLSGHVAARARGRGELLTPVAMPPRAVVLINPGVAVTAAEAYHALDSARSEDEVGSRAAHGAVTAAGEPFSGGATVRTIDPPGPLVGMPGPDYRNDLEEPVACLFPEVAAALEALRSAGLRGVMMSGSGPTCFGLAEDEEAASQVAAALRAAHPRWWVWAGVAGV